MRYNLQQKNRPDFQYGTEAIEGLLFDFVQRTGRINGVLEGFSEDEQAEAIINLVNKENNKLSLTKKQRFSESLISIKGWIDSYGQSKSDQFIFW